MNHQLWNRVGARIAAIAFIVGGLAACGDRLSETQAKKAPNTPTSDSAVVVGVAPAQPSGDPPGTTPVAPNTSDVTKQEESTQKPAEGDNHSYSTVAPTTPQKADGNNPADQPNRQ